MPVTSVTVRVPAKINLQLAVGPLRPDGYHGLVTVFHAISLFDEVTVTAADADSGLCGARAGGTMMPTCHLGRGARAPLPLDP